MAIKPKPGEGSGLAPAKKGKLAVIAVASLVLLGGGGFVAFKLRPASHDAQALAGAPADAGLEEPGSVAPEPFVLNLADPEGDRFLRLALRILLDRGSVAERLTADVLELARVRDRLLTVLSSKTADQITSFEGKEDLRAELARAVAPLFGEAKVLDVYFTEFLVQ
jgi:flagellar protein FliL